MTCARHAALIALPLLAPVPSLAQADLQSEITATLAPVANVDTLADTLNCTALFRALSLVFGPESDLFEGFQVREGYMASVGGLLWSETSDGAGQTPEAVFAVLLPLINTATDQYLAHMDAVTQATQTPFDDQVLDQVEFCYAVHDGLRAGSE